MAFNDAATLVIGAGNYFHAPEGTALPADLGAVGGPWENIGHTSLEDILSMESEGGEATVLGTLQSKQLRTTYSPRSESLKFTIQQFDADSLKLYYGSNMVAVGAALGVSNNPTPTVRAFLVVFTDGVKKFAFYAPKAELYRGDDGSFGDTESLAGLPIAVKPVQYQTNTWNFAVTPLTVPVPVVTAATPASAVQGATVTITGTGFLGATTVRFGATNATSFNVVSDTSITAVMPAGSAGAAAVTVITPGGTSNAFSYTRGA
ncbi:MAG: IPT/TIG domain-containing protein [Nocardioides sp.]